MKDVPIMIGIIVFWFLVTIIFTGIANDTAINTDLEGNTSTELIDVTNINLTDEEIPDQVTPLNFVDIISRVLTFRLGTVIGMPTLISSIISFINYMLISVFGVLLYRLIRHGGG